jgi:hypothetical protein
MNDLNCKRLDDYLADDLDASNRLAFEDHLARCIACSEEVRLQATIDRLLAAAQPSPPPELQRNIAASIRRRKLQTVAQFAAAAALLLVALAAWRIWTAEELAPENDPSANRGRRSVDVRSTESLPQNEFADAPRSDSIVREDDVPMAAPVVVDAGGTAIVVAEPSQDPTVHIFWLYPTVNVSMTAPGESRDSTDLERNPL